ncbi:Callose synthase 2 [Phytophthora cactorum]|uniref:1,3-beta-glucan synthase n=1 Tax=Phytophthora cactorum TaxID=29920 RepID=A0A329SQZ8_9STRA|nr:Callose synthase 2 [Phytophthora cactorum]
MNRRGHGNGNGNGSEREGSSVGLMTEALEMQRQMCDEAMSLVNAGVAMQNASPPNVAEAERKLTRAVDIMEQALSIRYRSADEKDAADRLNNKMMRYVKMIKSQRAKSVVGGGPKGRNLIKHNILEMERLPEVYTPVLQLLNNSNQLGDICESLKRTFGFQESSVLNQKEHLLLLLTNFKEQSGQDDGKKKKKKKKQDDTETIDDYLRQRDPQLEMDLANKGITRLHGRVFANYKKWCKYVSQKPKFSSDLLVDITLFFLIWGEAANFRQMPECLCFLLHTMLPKVNSGGNEEPGTFLANTIRPMYAELRRDSDKKTSKGARAPHREIRNYDDFNEFFWTKKSLKYDYTNIGEAFANYDKKGRPKIVKKTFSETRSWTRAIISFRRIFLMNCALFLATLGFSIDMVLLCPDSAIMYGEDVQPSSETGVLEILGKKYAATTGSSSVVNTDDSLSDDINTDSGAGSQCLYAKLATCLGVQYFTSASDTFGTLPQDFKELLELVPFTDCVEKTVGRCKCYHDFIDDCFNDSGKADEVSTEGSVASITYDQSVCAPAWMAQVNSILDDEGDGLLNCGSCQIDITSLAKKPTRIMDMLQGLIDFGRNDKGPMALLGGAAMIGLVCVCELQNRFFSGIGMGFVGRSMPVPMKTYCRYTCFWIVLYLVKLTFDYQFVVKTLVETTLFVYSAKSTDYLQYSHFMLQITYHNIVYILFLWVPAWMVFLYDAQIFYSVLSVIYGSFAGFNLRIGELRSFRILRLTFKSIPGVFNRKLVPNIVEEKAKKKKKKNKKNKNDKDEMAMPLRRFERISMSQGAKPLTVKTQKYSSLLEQRDDDDVYSEMKTPNGTDEDMSSQSSRSSNIGSITGVSGAEFERTIPFAMAWNRCLTSLREADVISDRELNVLSYLIDSKDTVGRKLYPPAFLTAGKLDESIDIVLECSALYEKLKTDKKKKDKVLQKIETTMRERLTKDDLRVESILGSYKFSSQVLRILLGEEHKELDDCYNFIEEMASHQQILKGLKLDNLYLCRAAAAELMKSILEVPKKSTETSIKFQRALYKVIDSVESVINCLKMVLAKQENLVQMLNDTPLKPNSFFFPGDSQHYASLQLQKIVNDEAALDIVSRAYQLLTVDNFDAEPRSEEGRRRLRFFANSLFMDMPEAKPIRKIRSLTVSTPYYNEIVMYSIKDLTAQNDDCIKLLYYLQTIYPFEWENLLERIQAKDMNEALKKNPEEVQLWASYRGQTLARTVRGMMYNAEAIRFLHWLEIGENEPMHQVTCSCNKCCKLNEMVALKFNYVCTCQIYGKQKDEQKQQAQDIDFLLRKHLNLRVAYVDGPKKVKDGPPKFFSVLIRSQDEKIVEIYRVELPGNPIVGEGKPENQNHAIIFSRGELLQCIDMNQDGYLEEALKMPNLLSTMDRGTEKRPLTIIGFREHVFTGGVSNLASFMSIQELSFVSLGQRMLAINHVRQHYGHPDIFDKLFAMGCGGTAKASKGVNLSEDIFAGFNSTLRGGRVSHEEFIQVGKGRDVGMQQLALFEAKLSSGAGECVISRDAMRMASRLDFFRLHSWFYGNLGWYFTQTMTVVGVYFFIYGKVYMALSGMDSFFLEKGGLGIGGTLNTSWAFQFGFLLVVPVVAVVGVEQGFRHGVTYLIWNIMTLGPLFFTFQMGTRMHYFDRTLIHGGAKYRATGRGFTIKHEKFAELFRFYAFSHFYRGVELLFLLLMFYAYGTFSWCNCSWRLDADFYNNVEPTDLEWRTRCYDDHYQSCVLPTNQNYGIMSYSLWIIAATWMWAPFFFNPSGLDWDKIIEDYNDWQNWLKTTNDSADSWFGWWSNEQEYLEHTTRGARFVAGIRKLRFLLVAIGMYLNMMYNAYFERPNRVITSDDDMLTYALSGLVVVIFVLLICCGYIASRVTKKMSMKQRKLRKMKFLLSCCCFLISMLSLTVLSVGNLFAIFILLFVAVYWFMQMCILRLQYHHIVVRALARAYDRAVGWIVFGPIMIVSMFLPFISSFQQRVMFNNAFTSGLEVSKLFAHDVAPAQVVKVKRVSKKKKNRDD